MSTLTRNGKRVVINFVADKTKPEYPSDFFDKGYAPNVSVPRYSGSLQALIEAIKAEVKTNKINVNGIKVFLYEYFKTVTNNLEEDWISFGRRIGSRNESVHPFSCVEVRREGEYSSTSSQNADPDEGLWLATLCLSLYRIGKVTDENYRKELSINIDKIMRTIHKNSCSISSVIEFASLVSADNNYCKLVACIDMYFSKFKGDDRAICRIGTCSSRYRDSAGLLSINHLAFLSGGDPADGISWALVPTVQKDIDRLIVENQETEKADSYTPYLIDLQISRLSPYSTTANPAFHLFVHAAGTFALSARSINAKLLDAPDMSSIIKNAGFFIMAVDRTVDWNIGFKKREENEDQLELRSKISQAKFPKTTNVHDWMNWRKTMKEEFDPILEEFMKDRASRIGATRNGSIGHHIKMTYGVIPN
ncbi:nucleoprotein [Bimbo virus]|uniref:Nucleoprotein n=1 Tax=Bimbo virus TaxID=864694 RepID=A0AAE9BN34_9RHAB|nr:nucleoprotein [Bimbo virus]UAU42866.1 nucleoprotein [Bimbo virus]WAD86851.1 nucleoprotein [Bimbo virus]